MSREVMQRALDALKSGDVETEVRAVEALKAALAQPQAEPVAWISAESLRRLKQGGNDSRGTVPVHATHSMSTHAPLFLATPQQAQPPVPDPWRMAVDAAMVAHVLDCTTPDSDPKQCVELLCKQVADIWRDIAAPAALAVQPQKFTDEQLLEIYWKASWNSDGNAPMNTWERDYSSTIHKGLRAVANACYGIAAPGSADHG